MASAHWADQLFLEHADIFLRIHEAALDRAEAQARGIAAILDWGNVRPPASILDAPCGIGRHDTHLEKFGYHVTGVDYSPAFLDRARRLAAEVGVSPEFLTADIRHIRSTLSGRRGSFSAILNLWTSIGYWDEETDRHILEQFRELAAPQGLLVLDTVNRDWLVRNFRPHGYEEWGDLVHVEERTFDVRTSWILGPWRFYTRRDGDLIHKATMSVDHRVYAGHELKRLAESAGWRVVGVFGGFEMAPLGAEHPRLVLVARREG